MKQSAVEWLAEQFEKTVFYSEEAKENTIKQAKEMFEEQITDAYQNGDNNGADRIYYHSDRDDKSAQQYYNETFKSE